jgi:hypothetical protein
MPGISNAFYYQVSKKITYTLIDLPLNHQLQLMIQEILQSY